jgi:hypothetical protein
MVDERRKEVSTSDDTKIEHKTPIIVMADPNPIAIWSMWMKIYVPQFLQECPEISEDQAMDKAVKLLKDTKANDPLRYQEFLQRVAKKITEQRAKGITGQQLYNMAARVHEKDKMDLLPPWATISLGEQNKWNKKATTKNKWTKKRRER